MRATDLLKRQSEIAFTELLDSLDGVSEAVAWAIQPLQPGEYMHSEGSILSVVVHVAGAKFVSGSAGYKGLEIRWRDVIERMESFWPGWAAARAYLQEAQEYWLDSWSGEDDLEKEVTTHSGKRWPSWKVISTMSHHDSYHAGQIQFLRSVVAPSGTPPPGEGDLSRKHCGPSPSW